MTTPTAPAAPPAAAGLVRPMLKRMLQILVEDIVFGAILFVSAGTLRWANAWVFMALFLVLVIANGIYVVPKNPELIAERGRTHKGTRSFDHVLMTIYTVCYLLLFVVCGLDAVRFGWARLGWPWALAGGVLLAVSNIPVAGAMAVNRNLEPTVRIQEERGHEVAITGPYRYVRHPMYVGMLLQLPATVLLLGSLWALLPALACFALMVARTALEDRTLRRDLPGYQEYAARTRYRLVPGVW